MEEGGDCCSVGCVENFGAGCVQYFVLSVFLFVVGNHQNIEYIISHPPCLNMNHFPLNAAVADVRLAPRRNGASC